MGWDALIVGDLSFPKGAIDTWKAAPASAVAPGRGWPWLIAQAVVEPDDDDDEDDVLTVDEMLRRTAKINGPFGSIAIAGTGAKIRFWVDNSNYAMVGDDVMRLVFAAARVGVTGRIVFCDLADAQGDQHGTGGAIAIARGKLTVEPKNAPFAGADKKLVAEYVAERLAEIAPTASPAVADKSPRRSSTTRRRRSRAR